MSKNFMGRVWDFLGLVEEEDAWAPSSVLAPVGDPPHFFGQCPSDPQPAFQFAQRLASANGGIQVFEGAFDARLLSMWKRKYCRWTPSGIVRISLPGTKQAFR